MTKVDFGTKFTIVSLLCLTIALCTIVRACVCASVRVCACVCKVGGGYGQGVMMFNAVFNNISVIWWRFAQVGHRLFLIELTPVYIWQLICHED
jgi:hypothetical protein